MSDEYISTLNDWYDSLIEFKADLGYALFHKEKRGVKAWIWRKVGHLFNRDDWHNRGMEEYNPFERVINLWGYYL